MTDTRDRPPHRSAALLSIGDELVLGQTLDTNTAWLADRLFTLGVTTHEHTTVDDDARRIAQAIERLGDEADLIIITGGLGPTEDDLTREALGRVLAGSPDSEPVAFETDPAMLEALKKWFAHRPAGMPERNTVQATHPAGSVCLPNPNGTAPGLHAWIERLGFDVFCLPGPPHEMKPMVEAEIVPQLRIADGAVTRVRLLLTIGLGESAVADRIADLMDRERHGSGAVQCGTTASKGVVTVRMRVTAASEVEAATLLDECERDVTERLGGVIFDRRDPEQGDSIAIRDALPRAIIDLLRDRGETIGVVESCTGGLLGESITEIAGSSDVFVGGFLTYSNEMKTELVGVDPEIFDTDGAVSERCALAMAGGGLERTGAAHCLSITGIAGPGGGSDEKPVGTVFIGRASADGTGEARRFRFRGGRKAIREWSQRAALAMLRMKLVGIDMTLLAQVER
ncbi:MAG: CinA family nicotinamide mononucleotide deamidase-related protein [Planctomycetota bacterium]